MASSQTQLLWRPRSDQDQIPEFIRDFTDRPEPILVPGLIPTLQSTMRSTTSSILCNTSLCGFGQRDNWTCGYRNIQMMITSLIGADHYGHLIGAIFSHVPNILRIQQLIEDAWQQGFDTAGAEHFGFRLQHKSSWIGTTEAATLLRSLNIRCKLIDCRHGNLGLDILQLVASYFSENGQSNHRQHLATTKPTIYFQSHGHSMTVAGVEFNGGVPKTLLVIDPIKLHLSIKKSGTPKWERLSARQLDGFSQCQMLSVEGVGWQSDLEREHSKVLRASLNQRHNIVHVVWSTMPSLDETKRTGTVKFFNNTKGFGFITPDDDSEDLFVHQTSIYARGYRSLANGEPVEYNIEIGDDGRKKAVNVTGPNGDYVQGTPPRQSWQSQERRERRDQQADFSG